MNHNAPVHPPRRVHFITHLRTASDLLVKILNLEEQNTPTSFRDALDEAEAHNQIAFVKEHALLLTDPVSLARYISRQSRREDESKLSEQWKVGTPDKTTEAAVSSSLNKTVLHDDFLLTFKPTFIITTPEIVTELAKHVDPDPSKLKYEWPAATKEEVAADHISDGKWKGFTTTISDSSGIRKDKSGVVLDVKAEEEKWKIEFGDFLTEQIARWVAAAIEDYGFFRERG